MNILLITIVLLGGSLISISKIRHNNLVYWIIAVCLSLILSNRNDSVPDTNNYASFFFTVDLKDISSLSLFSYEPGFQTYTYIIKCLFGNNLRLYFFVGIIFNIILLWYSVKILYVNTVEKYDKNLLYKNAVLFLILYFPFWGLFYNAIVIRAGIAISLLFLATAILSKRTLGLKDFCIILIDFVAALSFHYSAIIGIAACLIYKFSKQMSSKAYLYIWTFIFLIFISHISVFIVKAITNVIVAFFNSIDGTDYSKYSYYLEDLYKLNAKLPYKGLYLFAIGYIFISFKTSNIYYYKSLNVYLTGLLLTSLLYSIEQISRVTDYFLIYSVWLLFYILRRNRINTINILLYFSIVIIQLIFFIRILKDA